MPGSAADHPIHKWNGAQWNRVEGGAVRIDVDGLGIPIVLNDASYLYMGNEAGTSWSKLAYGFTDVAVGPHGNLWGISHYIAATNGDKYIYKHGKPYQYDVGAWDQTNGAARRISVGASGVVWIVNSDGRIYRGTFQ